MKKNLLVTFIFLLSIGCWGQIATFEFPSINSLVCSNNEANLVVSDISFSSGTI